jgi:hypothetical protein
LKFVLIASDLDWGKGYVCGPDLIMPDYEVKYMVEVKGSKELWPTECAKCSLMVTLPTVFCPYFSYP